MFSPFNTNFYIKQQGISMITKEDKATIKDIIGHRYAPIIQLELNASKEFNKDGGAYSRSQITNVMNGENHEVIEAAIYRVVEKRLEIQKQREYLLNKKSVAVTTDS